MEKSENILNIINKIIDVHIEKEKTLDTYEKYVKVTEERISTLKETIILLEQTNKIDKALHQAKEENKSLHKTVEKIEKSKKNKEITI